MVKQINNVPSIIPLNPVKEVAQNPLTTGNNVMNEIEGYIKLIERVMDLMTKFKSFQNPVQEAKVINTSYVPDMLTPDLNKMPTPSNPEGTPETEVKQVNEGGTMDINIDFILTVLEQIDSLKQGITVREVIDFIKADKDTVDKIIKMNMPKGV